MFMLPRTRHCLALLSTWAACIDFASAATDDLAFFENEVRPLLVQHCYECHSQETGKQKGGLLLDRREGWEIGGDAGTAIVPGDLEKSLLIHSIRYLDEDLQMPPKSRLSDAEVAVLEKWVSIGAPDPRDASLVDAVRKTEIDFSKARQGWAFRPHQDITPPTPSTSNWARTDADRFILAKLEERGLQPAPDAEARDLVRRLHYDLTGLPPTMDEAATFVAAFQASPEAAMGQRVDQLLSSKSFGEKWGRHWLDVVRYADSNGGDRNFTFYQAWRYRNYVIDAFNQDKSFHDFVREQIAGDLMSTPDAKERHDQLVASTFLALGPKMLTERDKEKIRMDAADEQIDTIGRAFLGLTLGCARCHDHKFDPISQEDYYALAGIFHSTQVVMGTRNGCVNVASWVEQPLPIPEPARSELAMQMERLELTMRLKVERDFMKKAGGKMSAENLPLAGVLYDDADAELVGKWKESTLFPSRFGERYLHDDKKNKGGMKAIFRGSLPESGVYEVRVAYSAAEGREEAVPITIEGWGEEHHVHLDQSKKPSVAGLFEPIGRFRFEKGGRVTVIISNEGTKGFVMVDAVQFIAEKDIARESMALAMAVGETAGDPLFTMNSGELAKELTKQIKELKDADLAMTPRDAEDADDCHLRIRGEVNQLGKKVARNFPQVLHDGPPPNIPEGSSGRLQLSDWLAGDDNALVDRVIVNRIWAHLFGHGIVGSLDNFGKLGEEPSHPELLDFLAHKFRTQGGSFKSTIRELVLSRTYRLAALPEGKLVEADPENHLFGRRNLRRLTAEEIRDSVLALSGTLSDETGTATANRYGEDLDQPMTLEKETLRTVYLPVARNNLVAELEVFDAANPDLVTGERAETTVPTQALYLLHSRFLQKQSAELAKLAYATADPVSFLHELTLGRPSTKAESTRAEAFLANYPGDREMALADLAHVLLASTEFLFLD